MALGNWTALVGAGIGLWRSARIGRLSNLDYWRRETARLQLEQLSSLLARAKGTEFGREHRFSELARLDGAELLRAYRATVPVQDYAGFRESIDRMRVGAEPNVLWPGIVTRFAQTSGTTAGDKFIPVSREMMRSNFQAAMDIFGHASLFGVSLPSMTAGRCLFLGGSTTLETSSRGIRTGDLSGIVAPLIRWPLSAVYSPGPGVALMSHWPSKIEAMARLCVDQDIRMISGMPSWGLVLMERVLELARERGRPAACLRDVWPNLRLFVHGGVKYSPFDARIRRIWSGEAVDVPRRLELYPASEGFIAMQDTPGEPGLRLLSDIGNFYEFVPLEKIDKPDAPAYSSWEVEKGVRYVVIMSTCAGMWRYNIGDVVEFDTVPGDLDGAGGDGPCRLRIVGRHRHFINAFGENLIVEHIENAVAEASSSLGVEIGEFTAAPVYPGPGTRAGLELVVEVTRGAESASLLGMHVDASLKRQCVDYGTKRTDGLGMGAPMITVVASGTIHRWMESRGKLGGQHKCPRCANHREFVDGIREKAGLERIGARKSDCAA